MLHGTGGLGKYKYGRKKRNPERQKGKKKKHSEERLVSFKKRGASEVKKKKELGVGSYRESIHLGLKRGNRVGKVGVRKEKNYEGEKGRRKWMTRGGFNLRGSSEKKGRMFPFRRGN